MKEKILAAIRTKFPKVNLSKKRLADIAARIEKITIDDETKIDAAIDEFDSFNPITEIAKHDDTVRNLQAKLNTPAPAKTDTPDTTVTDDLELPDDTPAWAKALVKQSATLAKTVETLQREKASLSIKDKAAAALKDIPTNYWSKRALPDSQEAIDAFVEEVKTDYQEFTKEATEKGFLSVPTPGGGGSPDPTKAKAVDPAVKAFAEKANAAAAKNVVTPTTVVK